MHGQLMKGNDAVIRGAILGGATHFFGYPITPASEIAHAAALYFPQAGGTFLQAECEVNAINMVYGAAAAGARVMTATAGPGLSLMAEGLSYIAGAELPCVLVDVQRAGPGLGNIWPEQSDYNAVVKGGGHGNYRTLVLAPNSAQEMCDFTRQAFDLADTYRVTVCILTDAYIGQLMEPVRLPEVVAHGARKTWALNADRESRGNLITSIFMNIQQQSAHNQKLQEKYALIEAECGPRWEEIQTEDAEILFVAFGISARICLTAVQRLRAAGVRAGLLRPQTLYPFPAARLEALAATARRALVVELNNGMMAEDVERAVRCRIPVERLNWMGGAVPAPEDLVARARESA